MFRKILTIFRRDLKVNMKDALALYIIIFPILFAIAINLFTPGINDTTVNLALLEGENPAQVEYFKQFAKVELFDDEDAIEERLLERDDMVAILPEGDSYYILAQGNESEQIVDYAKLLNTFYALDVSVEDSVAQIVSLNRIVPPIKKMLVNAVMIFASVLGGMLIAINIVEEKADNTISAINVTTVSRNAYILGKSMIGILYPIIGSVIVLTITGFYDVNIPQIILAIFTSTLISLMVGFIQGLSSDDIMTAAGSIKLLFLPMIGAIVGYEVLADKWQKFFYWIPFYWTYKANDVVLSKSGTWGQILGYTGIVFGICAVIYILLIPKIRKGLE